MFCNNCENQVDENINFCSNCGEKINKEENIKNKKELPLKWYKFYRYIRLPLGVTLNISNLLLLFNINISYWTTITYFIFLILIVVLIVQISTFFLFEHTIGYKINIGLIIMEILLFSFNSVININRQMEFNEIFANMLIMFGIFSLIWGIPNYVYFRNRKYLFNK